MLFVRQKFPKSSCGTITSRSLHQYACHSLEKREYVPLWYFCSEGCAEVADENRQRGDDALGITRTESGLAFKPAAASRPSKNALHDHELTWRQYHSNFLVRINIYNWHKHYISSLLDFFGAICTHLLRSHTNLCFSRVRREWHDSLTRGVGFNIGVINEQLLDVTAREVNNSIQANLEPQVSLPFMFYKSS